MLPSELRLACLGHCYVHIPENLLRENPKIKPGDIISIRSLHSDQVLHALWSGLFGHPETEIDYTFAQANNLKDELIVIEVANDVLPIDLSSLTVELLNPSEYSILSQHIEANLLDRCKLVFKDVVIPIWLSGNVKVLVKVIDLQPHTEFGYLNKFTELRVDLPPPSSSSPQIDNNNSIKASDIDEPISDPDPFVSSSLGINYDKKLSSGSMIICGQRGSGKSYLLNSILKNYKKFHCDIMNCKQLRGKRPETVKKIFNELLVDGCSKQPTLLGLDDIDAILTTDIKHEDEKGPDAIYRHRLLDLVCRFMLACEQTDKILVIATCKDLESLDKRISASKGRRYFGRVVNLGELNNEQRVAILKSLIQECIQVNTQEISEDQIKTIAKKCVSFMPSDLKCLVERSIINACSRSKLEFDSDPIKMQAQDLIESLEGFVPTNLRSVSLEHRSGKTFDCIGGLESLKTILKRTIMLPIKHPKLYSLSPIRPQTSILLYGPPGCGKTLLAEAMTNLDDINSICVRGPELLSKYIGASEAAVRDLFRRAELAKPCVLFFDEFESLVPKRGSDSTGVTDRVVNQFLTIMDGVERLSTQVFILAATSRPDMIDPAIMRPGRLDRHLYCPMPNESDRLDILRVLSSSLKIADYESNASKWARDLEGFTGADIQSLLYSAQVKALHETVERLGLSQSPSKSASKQQSSDFELVVEQRHLESTYGEMKPEVRAKLEGLMCQYPREWRTKRPPVSSRATLM